MSIIDIINYIDSLVWGLPAVIILAGTGLAVSILSGFAQIRYFRKAFKNMMYKGTGAKGEIRPFAVWCAVMGATVGVGNIAGVSTAIHLGGAGALFWMWVCAILGMMTKAIEATLANYTKRVTPEGQVEGGTPYYIRLIPVVGPALAVIFSIFTFIAAFGIGNMVQANSVAHAAEYIAGMYKGSPEMARLLAGILMLVFTALVVIGGLKRIAEVSNYLVPFMVAWYIASSIGALIMYAENIPLMIKEIFTYAFTPQAAAGGLAGWTVYSAIRYGFARSLFSNEAGLGSAPNAYAYMAVDHPGRTGLYGMMEVFMDTIVVCSMTGFVDIVTRAYIERTDLTGAALAAEAFRRVYGDWAPIPLGVALALFAYTTLISWEWYGEVNWVYFWSKTLRLPEKPVRWVWRVMWVIPILPAAIAGEMLEVFWNFADMANGLMAIPNLIAVAYFAPVGIGLIKEFLRIGKI